MYSDQLCSYCIADLSLWFRICRLLVFLCRGSYDNVADNTVLKVQVT